jgi:hypothetical protein
MEQEPSYKASGAKVVVCWNTEVFKNVRIQSHFRRQPLTPC